MVYRLFRDTYQSVAAGTEAEKREARKQLFGITGSMMLHAGISGTWLFGIAMMVGSLIFGKQPPDLEEEFKGAVIDTFGAHLGGALWYGIPGYMLGVDLTARVGMADLWFKSPDRPLEGQAMGDYWLEQMTGAIPQIMVGFLTAAQKAGQGDYERALESMVPSAMRNVLKAYRYAMEGATTKDRDPIVDQVPTYDVLVQALGFTPARIKEQNDLNNRLYNLQTAIEDERSRLVGAAAKATLAGREVPADTLAGVDAFNAAHPQYSITGQTVNQSARSRAMMHQRNDSGIALNPKLDNELRSGRPPMVFN